MGESGNAYLTHLGKNLPDGFQIRSVAELQSTVSGSDSVKESIALEVLNGLSQTPKRLSSMYFYDHTGSELYEKITEQEEYYLYECEKEVLERNKSAILRHIQENASDSHSTPHNIVELGAGDGSKTKILLEHFYHKSLDFVYVPIDISSTALLQLSTFMGNTFNGKIRVEGICGDNMESLRQVSRLSAGKTKNFVMFLGSSIGNFGDEAAIVFLRNMWNYMNHGDLLLIGADLVKNPELLLPAYKDQEGYTTEFNFNLLDRINRDLGANFNRKRFQHYHFYNPRRRCMESWLMSTIKQNVWVEKLQREFSFDAWEGIHVEDSFKYSEKDIFRFATTCGFEVLENLYDSKGFFVDSVWRVIKEEVSP
jgi:L-histidine N-alpha-methyltransferase